jgi:UDP-glucuronate decarboxylase
MQALRGEPITIYGDGAQTRSFCYVDDLIDGLVGLMRSPAEVTGPINLGNPVEFTMIELARQVLAITGSSSSLVHADLPADDPRQRQPDITRARNLLGWEPEVPLERGLQHTVAYFRDIVEAATPA